MQENANDSGIKKEIPWNVPFLPKPNFLGRNEEMDRLRKLLRDGSPVAITQGESGNGGGGVGKTQLAVEYAHKFRDDYPGGVLWLRGGEDVIVGYAELAEILGLELPGEMEEEEKCSRVQKCLDERKTPTLLILDSLDEEEENKGIERFLPATPKCHLIITTRCRDFEWSPLSLDVLTDEMALELLLSESGRKGKGREDDEEYAREICRLLGNLPLTLEIAGRYLMKLPFYPYEKYYRRLRAKGINHRPRQAEAEPAANEIRRVWATLAVNPDIVDNVRIMKLITALVCFLPDNINPELLSLVCGQEEDNEENEVEKFGELINVLADFAIIRVQRDNRLSLHRLTRKAILSHVGRYNLIRRQRAYVKHLEKWFVAHNDTKTVDVITPEFPHIMEAANLAFKLNIWPQSYVLSAALQRYRDFKYH